MRSWILAAAVILTDQVSKIFFGSRIIKNPDLPFGINLPGFFDFYLILVLFGFFVLGYWFYFRKWSVGFVLIIGGALSNLVDRIGLGYVRDFIDIGIATMNLADMAIWMGIGMLLFNIKILSAKS